MSGGNFDYAQDRLFDELFPDVPGFARYDLEGHQWDSKNAREANPLGDEDISELAHDLLCLISSYDWYIEGDIGEEQYRKDLAYFKGKWLSGGF